VGTLDNFFDLGANSLLMVQANSRLRAALRRELSLVDLFRYPTVKALAGYLNQTAPDPSALVQSQVRGRPRLDALQRRSKKGTGILSGHPDNPRQLAPEMTSEPCFELR